MKVAGQDDAGLEQPMGSAVGGRAPDLVLDRGGGVEKTLALFAEPIPQLEEPLFERERSARALEPPSREIRHQVIRQAVLGAECVEAAAGVVAKIDPVLQLQLPAGEGDEDERIPQVV